jgi:DNA repair protein RadC
MRATNDKQVREKFVAYGAQSLDDVELLSLLIAGKAGEESVVTSERLIAECSSLRAVAGLSAGELRQRESLGMERATRVVVAAELGRRVLVAESAEQTTIRDRNDVVSLFAPLICNLDHEELWVLYLSSSNRVIERRRISVGGSTSLTTDCKLIVRHALNLVAASLILVHNHPSGAAEPSLEDENFTSRLAQAADLFDIRLLDHIIVARNGGSYSFRSGGKL